MTMNPTTPTQLLEIEAKMTPGAWNYAPAYGVSTVEGRNGEAVAHAVEYLSTADAPGICAARNKLKDLAELWAWAEKVGARYSAAIESTPILASGQQYRDFCELTEILTRLGGD